MNTYKDKIEEYSVLFQKSNKRNKIISIFRLFVFVLAAIFIYFFARANSSGGIVITIFTSIVIFIYLVKQHSKVLTGKKLYQSLVKINEDELSGLDENFENFDKGEEFDNPDHPYAADVDIFGEGSLFQYLNRSASIIGKRKLANLLCHPFLDGNKIKENQQAIQEIR